MAIGLLRRYLWLLGLLFGSQVQALTVRHLTTDDGLPHPIVRTITRDVDGFVWLGTFHGLVRYDGHQLQSVRSPSGRR